ncbi:MAG TPA: ATP-binding cassette domain-containing protein [Candidatus Paceibacterota bacterium]|nr:ATP-binding cassette domain-containing protein [Candidatus Paceibacterota bacterium]
MEIRLEQVEPWPLRGGCEDSQVWRQSLVLRSGGRYLVKARSGRGKTTLLSILYGMRRDYGGEVYFGAADIRRYRVKDWSDVRQRRLGLVFQDLQLFDDLTAWENVEIKNRLTARRRPAEIQEMFSWLGLADRMRQAAQRLSVGQKQRVALIRALCQPFEILLLDEPFSHLDPENTERGRTLIDKECRAQGATLILTSLDADPGRDYDQVYDL